MGNLGRSAILILLVAMVSVIPFMSTLADPGDEDPLVPEPQPIPKPPAPAHQEHITNYNATNVNLNQSVALTTGTRTFNEFHEISSVQQLDALQTMKLQGAYSQGFWDWLMSIIGL